MALSNEKFEKIKSQVQKFVNEEMVPHEQDFNVNHKFADLINLKKSKIAYKRNKIKEKKTEKIFN